LDAAAGAVSTTWTLGAKLARRAGVWLSSAAETPVLKFHQYRREVF
jgi:hypothetical protein